MTGKRCKFCPGIAVTRVLKIYFFFHHHIQGSILLGECVWLCKLPLTVLEVRRRIRSEPARDLTLGEGIPRRESRYYSRILLLSADGTHGEGNGSPLQCSCLENPTDRGAWWATTVHGVSKSRTGLKQLNTAHSMYSHLLLPHSVLDCSEQGPREHIISSVSASVETSKR